MLVDTFLMADDSESDLLHLKFTLEDSGVDLWVIQENEYNLKGHKKGLYVEEILKEERFKPFLHKVKLISKSQNPLNGDHESQNFQREGWQRTFCLEMLHEVPLESWIIVSDVDEMIDFSSASRTQRFNDWITTQDSTCWVNRRRYWYDYDNACFLKDIRIPLVPMNLIAATNGSCIPQSRHFSDRSRTLGSFDEPVAFEYSYVMKSLDHLFQKKTNYSHTGFTRESVAGGLFLNCWPRSRARNEKLNLGQSDAFEMILLDESNSPKYVRDNLQQLKTNIVDPNYKQNRKSWTSEYTD